MTLAERFLEHIERARRDHSGPFLVALDGRSGTGKSTLALEVAESIDAAVINGDDFYAGGTAEFWDAMTADEKVRHVIDWPRQRTVLELLDAGQTATWHPYDWLADNGQLAEAVLSCEPRGVVILDGAYSARPELADLFSLRVLLHAEPEVRRARLLEREGERYRADWEARWEVAEVHYFGTIMPPEAFDVVVHSDR